VNKAAERYYVEHLQKHYPGHLPPSQARDTEEPDFLFDDDGILVGVEVTQLFKAGSGEFSEKQVIAFQKKSMQRAGEIYQQLHPERPIYFAAYFHNHVPMRDLEACARTLADVAFTSERDTHRQNMNSPKWLCVWTVIPQAETRFVANGNSDGGVSRTAGCRLKSIERTVRFRPTDRKPRASSC
jgi:hypothetical protein